MVVLIVLATLGFNLATRVASQRHRDNFIIDYTNACYARDSAIKYALTSIQDINSMNLISRPNEPDFSDLFNLSEPDYQKLLEQWLQKLIETKQIELPGDSNEPQDSDMNETQEDIEELDENGDIIPREIDEENDNNDFNNVRAGAEPNLLDSLVIPGPYGPPWPFVKEPVEFQIGTTTVKVTVEDENAKYPAGWAVLGDENVQRESRAGLVTFCEWMGYDSDRIEILREQFGQVGSIKPFKVDFKPVTQRIPVANAPPAARRRGARPQRTAFKTVNVPPTEQLAKQARDFSQLFHSSLVDTDMLAEPTIISEKRKESALKYMGMWGTTQVNINTAPRQVLEAAFTFGGDAEKIADEIIKKRKEKPFADIAGLKKELFRFSTNIQKCEPYITATSTVFTVHITATSGVAQASAVIVVFKQGDKIEQVAVISG